MLVLSRKEGEKIRIGDQIEVMIVRIGSNVVRLGIQAPSDVVIVREELTHTTNSELSTNNSLNSLESIAVSDSALVANRS